MASLIDQLKRLERLGSEKSKTTQKLIDAAKEVGNSIAVFASTELNGLGKSGDWKIFQSEFGIWFLSCRRRIEDDWSDEIIWIDDVYADRKYAIRLAEEISNGLLEEVSERLEEMCKENTEAANELHNVSKKPIG